VIAAKNEARRFFARIARPERVIAAKNLRRTGGAHWGGRFGRWVRVRAASFSTRGSGDQHVRVTVGGESYVLRVKREGVHTRAPLEGYLIAGPAKLVTGLRWLTGPRSWVVETRRLERPRPSAQVGGALVASEPFPTKAAAVDRANALLREWGAVASSAGG